MKKKPFFVNLCFYNSKQNKENLDCISKEDDNNDAESSHSDCLIIESNTPTSPTIDVSNLINSKIKYIFIF
jgi:hypothetical protein